MLNFSKTTFNVVGKQYQSTDATLVYLEIKAPICWWQVLDTMIDAKSNIEFESLDLERGFSIGDFSHENLTKEGLENLESTIKYLNKIRNVWVSQKDKTDTRYFQEIIKSLPSSYLETRKILLSYSDLSKIYKRLDDVHLDEWKQFAKRIEDLPESSRITGTYSYALKG